MRLPGNCTLNWSVISYARNVINGDYVSTLGMEIDFFLQKSHI
jgi:hypothetical protein